MLPFEAWGDMICPEGVKKKAHGTVQLPWILTHYACGQLQSYNFIRCEIPIPN